MPNDNFFKKCELLFWSMKECFSAKYYSISHEFFGLKKRGGEGGHCCHPTSLHSLCFQIPKWFLLPHWYLGLAKTENTRKAFLMVLPRQEIWQRIFHDSTLKWAAFKMNIHHESKQSKSNDFHTLHLNAYSNPKRKRENFFNRVLIFHFKQENATIKEIRFQTFSSCSLSSSIFSLYHIFYCTGLNDIHIFLH